MRNPWVISLNIICLFFIVCEDGFYGSSCNNICGHCLNEDSCDDKTGTCVTGCHSHFLYPFCKGKFKKKIIAKTNVRIFS